MIIIIITLFYKEKKFFNYMMLHTEEKHGFMNILEDWIIYSTIELAIDNIFYIIFPELDNLLKNIKIIQDNNMI